MLNKVKSGVCIWLQCVHINYACLIFKYNIHLHNNNYYVYYSSLPGVVSLHCSMTLARDIQNIAFNQLDSNFS